ncbi:MAG: 4Fe-4S dicluster domain-containing protein [Candidatus Aegiribacteria sp.]|nr:4Fe-4S dicluster domain-containing protein [Candidatus Aegiribacteria sp.]
MKTLIPAVILVLVSTVTASLTFSQDAGGSVIQWDPFEGSYDSLVLRCSETVYETEDPGWGIVLATVYPDSSGEFPASVQIPGAFIVDPDKCIACGICINQCPTDAITEDIDGKAVIDPDLCIACGICANVCPVDAIFVPSSGLYYGLFGVYEESVEEFIQESVQ